MSRRRCASTRRGGGRFFDALSITPPQYFFKGKFLNFLTEKIKKTNKDRDRNRT